MKKVYLSLLNAALVSFCIVSSSSAQSRLQIIHNSAAVSLDTVDIYLDNTKFDNVSFRSATSLLTATAGAHTLNINDRNSIDSGDMVLSRLPLSLVNNQAHIAMVVGVDVTANYAANPDGRTTDLRLILKSNVTLSLAGNQTSLSIFHGVSDAPGVDVYARPNALLTNSSRFGDVSTTAISPASVSTIIDVRDSNGVNNINSFIAPLQLFAKKSLAVFASGFLTPANNQNGAAFGLFAVDTNGGNAIELASTARLQIVHNSPDYIIDTVDVWANDQKIVDNLPFRKATAMLNIMPGIYDLTVAKKFSTDTSAAVMLFKVSNFVFTGGKTYLGFVSGVVDTNQYATNPSGIDRSFSIEGSDSYKEGTTTGQVELSFMNGVPDAPAQDLNEIGLPGLTKIGNDISFKTLSASAMIPVGNTMFNLTSADSTVFSGAYKLNTTAFTGRTGVVFTSGVNAAVGNPTPAQASGLFVVFSDGTVVPFTKLVADVQLVHNSADVTLDTIDVYVNGVKQFDNMYFRSASAFFTLNAKVPYSIAIAPKNSASVAQAVYTSALELDSSTNYYMIATGVINTANYVANPNSKNIALKLHTFKGARKVATVAKNVELVYFHGATDLQTTTAIGVGQVQFLSKNNSYGDFHGYRAQAAIDNIKMDFKDAVTEKVLYSGFAHLAAYQGKAGLAFASGYNNADAVTNQNGDTLIVFIAWPDGNIDSIAPPRSNTGIAESNMIDGSLMIYPNPAAQQFFVQFETIKSASFTIELTDIMGRIVHTSKYNASTGMNNVSVSVPEVSNGIYMMRLYSNEDSVTTKLTITR